MQRRVEPSLGWTLGVVSKGFLEELTSRLRPREKGKKKGGGRDTEGKEMLWTWDWRREALTWPQLTVWTVEHGAWGAGQWGEQSLKSCPTPDKVPEDSGSPYGNLALEPYGFQHLAGIPPAPFPLWPTESRAFWAKGLHATWLP